MLVRHVNRNVDECAKIPEVGFGFSGETVDG